MPHTTTLPIPLTTLIGREQEVATLRALLNREEVRLLTLTGPGGTGKTRLGLKLVAEHYEAFPDGVYFVNLAPVRDQEFVLSAIAQALTLRETGTSSLFDLLTAFLQDKRLLLLLDNFEQVLGAAPQLTSLLALCPHLKMVVTSREVLHVQGEQEFAVPPLTVPDPKHLSALMSIAQYEAVALFIQRTQTVKPDFQVTKANATTIAEICIRLDGLPLAIELAAARSKLLPPQALLARLGRRLAVLTSGSRDVPTRQQTLRNTIAWSYDLLTSEEQQLFRRFSVFVGGCTLEAIEALCMTLDGDNEVGQVLDSVASLLDKSLLRQREREGEEPRFWMLETLREFALELLTAHQELKTVQRAHAEYYLALALQLETSSQNLSLERELERDYKNLREALQWALEQGEIELALHVGGTVCGLWNDLGSLNEGRAYMEKVLAMSTGIETSARAKALYGAAMLAWFYGDVSQTTMLAKESLAIYQQLGDKDGIATCLSRLGLDAIVSGDYERGCALEEQALEIFRELGNQWGVSNAYLRLGHAAFRQKDFTRARSLFEMSLSMARALGDMSGILYAVGFLGQVAIDLGEYVQAGPLLEESLAMAQELNIKIAIIERLDLLVEVALGQGDLMKAQALSDEVLMRQKEFGVGGQRQQKSVAGRLLVRGRIELRKEKYSAARQLFLESVEWAKKFSEVEWNQRINSVVNSFMEVIACCLEGLAQVGTAQDDPVWAARLWGAAEIIHEAVGSPMPLQFNERPYYERAVANARASLSEHAFAAAWAEGRTMTPEQALASEGQDMNPTPITTIVTLPARVTSPMVYPDGLTTREAEVLRLLATGLTNIQVAEQLIISPRTVDSHLTSIYSKIGVSTRSAATRYALDHHLV